MKVTKKRVKAALRTLKDARKLIDSPDKWIKQNYYNYDHTAFCSIGAVNQADGEGENDAILILSQAVLASIPKGGKLAANVRGGRSLEDKVIEFNDFSKTTHTKVLDLFDLAERDAEAFLLAAVEQEEQDADY